MITIKLKEREVPLLYTTYEMKVIQEEIAPIGRAIQIVLGKNPDNEDESYFGSAEHLNAAAKMIRILGNAGLEEAGETPDLTDKKVMRAMKPTEVWNAVNACLDAMNEGMESEIPKKEQEGPVDAGLEEIERKKEKTS